MGKYGFKSGYGEFQNVQSGTVTIPTTSQDASVSFDVAMKNTPSIVVTPEKEQQMWITAKSTTGFTVSQPSGSSDTEVTVHWVAMDDNQDI